MNMHVLLQLLLKIGITVVVAILTLFGAKAQDVPAVKKQIHIKTIKDVDGKTVLHDTTILADTDAQLAEAIRGIRTIKGDSALARMLKQARVRVSGIEYPDIARRVEELTAKGMVADTAIFNKLKNGKVTIFRLDSMLSAADRKVLLEKMQAGQHDPALLRFAKPQHLHPDSLGWQQLQNIVIYRSDDSLALNRQVKVYRSVAGADSAFFRRYHKLDQLNLDPASVERIIVRKSKTGATSDTIELNLNTSRLQIIHDNAGGQKKINQIDEAGELKESKQNRLSGSGTRSTATTIVIVNTNLSEITAQEKRTLEAAGATIESGPKEELKPEEISFYPNPSSGRFHISFKLNQKGNAQIRVYSSAGREVYNEQVKKLEEYNREIDLSAFGSGVYFVQVAQGKRYITRKLVVQ